MSTNPDSSTVEQDAAPAEPPTEAPAGSRNMPWLPRLGWAVAIAVIASLVWLGLFGEVATVSVVTTALMYLLLAQAWNLLGGYGGYLNLGMAAFFGVGAYTTGILSGSYGFSILIALPAAMVVGALFALIVGGPTLRLRGPYFTIITLILSFLVMIVVYNADFTRGAMGLFLDAPAAGPLSVEQFFFFLFLAGAMIVVLLVWWLERTAFVYALRAIKEDEDAAEVLGVATTRVKIQALVVGSVIAGFVGGLNSYRLGYIEPGGVFDLNISIDVVLMAVIGGAGSWIGPVIGAPLIVMLSEFLRTRVVGVEVFGEQIPRESSRMVLGLLLLLAALYAKRGIVGLVQREKGSRFGV
ncbi:branched-chain amino acid ABC transporter permease [Egibacter rhizosphaerae]|uniref:Branched-chain amino acid ABC transporter permease n=1 Tax=Egibacter rhizosphaerae TaxID=1670831 RepID=A0A411YIJ1_9ACTN|nr:branched-chain amino acid ABC transporter permease [Egibacter rhizosphaerae]QBI20892.1 branched-chain amino acid ABC transporter permease [Egibacter rhizosphaerae]